MKEMRIDMATGRISGNASNLQQKKQNVGRPLPDPDAPLPSFAERERERQRAAQRIADNAKAAPSANPKKSQATKKANKKRQALQNKQQNLQTKRMQPAPNNVQRQAAMPPQARQKHRLTKAEIKHRRTRKRIITLLLIFLLVCIGVLLTVKLLFKVSKYRIDGECQYSQSELTKAFGVQLEDNMFSFDIEKSQQQMYKALPYLESIKIRRQLPGTVVFFVQQAAETFAVQTDDGYLILSQQLKILRKSADIPSNVAIIHGIADAKGEIGTKFVCEDTEKQTTIDKLLIAVNNTKIGTISEISVEDTYDVWFVADSRFKIIVGTMVDLDYKLRLAEAVITEKMGEGERAVLNVSSASTTKSVSVDKDGF